MSGQSASLSLKEAKAMQESIQHPCSQARSGGSHSHDTMHSDGVQKKKMKSEHHSEEHHEKEY